MDIDLIFLDAAVRDERNRRVLLAAARRVERQFAALDEATAIAIAAGWRA